MRKRELALCIKTLQNVAEVNINHRAVINENIQMKWWHKLLILFGVILVICCTGLIVNTAKLNKELEASKAETVELLKRVDELQQDNETLLSEVAVLEDSVATLKVDVEVAKKQKIKLVEKIKYVEPVNDTIETFIALDSLNNGIIRDLEKLVAVQSIQIENYKVVIENDELIKQQMSLAIKRKDEEIEAYNKQLKKAKNSNVALGTTTTVAIVGIILLALL
jgi:hypothetical protein